jgi:hypothetical protein
MAASPTVINIDNINFFMICCYFFAILRALRREELVIHGKK